MGGRPSRTAGAAFALSLVYQNPAIIIKILPSLSKSCHHYQNRAIVIKILPTFERHRGPRVLKTTSAAHRTRVAYGEAGAKWQGAHKGAASHDCLMLR
jgi:hypothetical protein